MTRRIASLLICLCPLVAGPSHGAVERSAAQQEYWAQFDKRDWAAAIKAAEELVAQLRADGAPPLELAEALSLLGNAQFGSADYVSAEQSFVTALELTETHGGAMSGALLEPLRGLGYTLAQSGRHEEAVEPLERALRIAHRQLGLFDIGQQGLLRQLAKSLSTLGRVEDAEQHMSYLERVAVQTYGADDPRVSPVLCIVGQWRSEVGRFETARDTYRRALQIIERKLGKSHLAAIEPLRGIASTYTQELYYSTLGLPVARERAATDAAGRSKPTEPLHPRHLPSEGEKALERALKIAESQTDAPLGTHAQVLIALADWRQLKQQKNAAFPLYQRAAALMARAREGATPDAETAQTLELLSFPVRLYYAKPWAATRNLTAPRELVDEEFVEVEFTVTRAGEVADLRVVERSGSERQAEDTIEAMRAARYRPKFVAGEAVDTPGVRYREVFRTRKANDESQS